MGISDGFPMSTILVVAPPAVVEAAAGIIRSCWGGVLGCGTPELCCGVLLALIVVFTALMWAEEGAVLADAALPLAAVVGAGGVFALMELDFKVDLLALLLAAGTVETEIKETLSMAELVALAGGGTTTEVPVAEVVVVVVIGRGVPPLPTTTTAVAGAPPPPPPPPPVEEAGLEKGKGEEEEEEEGGVLAMPWLGGVEMLERESCEEPPVGMDICEVLADTMSSSLIELPATAVKALFPLFFIFTLLVSG